MRIDKRVLENFNEGFCWYTYFCLYMKESKEMEGIVEVRGTDYTVID